MPKGNRCSKGACGGNSRRDDSGTGNRNTNRQPKGKNK